MTEYRHLQVARQGAVGWLWLNRPEQRNALSGDIWEDLPRAVSDLSEGPETRAIVVAARGPAFTVGIDLALLASLQPEGRSDSDANPTCTGRSSDFSRLCPPWPTAPCR